MTDLQYALSYRDQEWLENLLADIWYRSFADVPQDNDVIIRWGKRARRRLGSISVDPRDMSTSVIRVNRLFQDLDVPEFVVRATIFHEMTHYAHGFNSPLEQKQKHPHSGGVIRKEFAERGQVTLYEKQRKWLDSTWITILRKHHMI